MALAHTSLALEGQDKYTLKISTYGAGEMTQGGGEIALRWLRALTADVEDLGSIPSTHMAAHKCL